MISESYINTESTNLKELLQQGRDRLRAAEQIAEIKKRDDEAREARERNEAWMPIIVAARFALPEYLHVYLREPDYGTRPAAYDAEIALEAPGCVIIRIKLMKSDTGSGPFWELEEKPYLVPFISEGYDDENDEKCVALFYENRSDGASVTEFDDLAVALALAEQRARELKAAQARADQYNSEEARAERRFETVLAPAASNSAPNDAEALFLIFERIAETVINNHPLIKELLDL